MLTCASCEKKFKTSVIINGKKRSLSQRKHCLECVPYGQRTIYRNKPVIPGKRHEEREFVCQTCNLPKKNKTRNNECSSCRNKKIRLERKTKAIQGKGGSCQICHYNKYIGALDFHHLEDQQKENSLSQLWLLSINRINTELDKCVLLCKVCHAEVHGGITKCP
jgi:hypothetical protein